MKDQCYQFLKNELGKVDIVGFGSYGEVKLARNTQNNDIVAIKMIYNKNAKEQIDVHHKLNHLNIIKLINYYYQKEKNITYMVLEYASGGSLNEKIKFGYGQLNKQLVKRYFRDICEAVKYLHENNYMHRDIKPENILITRDNHAKLCDFGFASILEYRSTLCGTFQYMAPQMIQKKPYDYKIDIWALGILLFELIQGFAPFRGETGEEVITEMKKPLKFSSRFENEEIDLIKKILRVNAQNRPQISKIFEHPYFDKKQGEQIPKQIQETKVNKQFKIHKDLKELKEEDVVTKQLRDLKIDNPEAKKKEGERKFDFLQRKGEKKEEKKVQVKKEQVSEKIIGKQFPKQQIKKQQGKKQFKPYIPPNLQNARSGIKSPIMKQMPPNGFIPLPVSPNNFPQNPHQFNSSMQVPPSHVQHGSLNSSAYQYNNPNSSMTTTSSTKYFPSPHQVYLQPPAPIYTPPLNFTKPPPNTYFMQQRSPNHQSFNNAAQQQIPPIQTNPNLAWKKT